jgi:hypothetical protein
MEKLLRNAPTISVVIVLLIQLKRVADFGQSIGAGMLAWVYAIFLAFTIYALSYWTGRLHYEVTAEPDDKRRYAQQVRMAKTYERARFTSSLWLILFIGIDGWLNLAETMAKLPADVLLWQRYGAIVYGVFPTLAAFGLGMLQSMIDKIPAGAGKASFAERFAERALATLLPADSAAGAKSATLSDAQSAADSENQRRSAKVFRCECGWTGVSPQAYSGHCRQCATHKAVKDQAIPVEMPHKAEVH